MSDFEEMMRGLDGTPEGAEAGTSEGVPQAGQPEPWTPGPGVPGIAVPEDDQLDDHARYDRATFLFETKSYGRAATLLEPLVADNPHNAEVTLLLARSYYHAAALGRAESVLRGMLERWPSDAYAHLLLARTLQRAGRAQEGAPHLKIAEAMGLDT